MTNRFHFRFEIHDIPTDFDGLSAAGLRLQFADAQWRAETAEVAGGGRADVSPEAAKWVLDRTEGGYEAMADWQNQQDALLHDLHLRLAQRGWSPLRSLTILQLGILGYAASANPVEVDNILSRVISERLDDIEYELIDSHPTREVLLAEAFGAHRNGQYSLSISAFIIQADGICYDTFGRSLFIGNQREGISHALLSTESENLPVIQPLLSEPLPLWLTQSQRTPEFDELNRHLVLHGVTTTDNTEQNSLKAISFLSWLNFSIKTLISAYNAD